MIEESQLVRWIERACLFEATARKPGNVHPQAEFADLNYADFVTAARAVAPLLARSRELGVGPAIRQAVLATLSAVPRQTNPNLGIILLLAPLCAVPQSVSLADGIEAVLRDLTLDDAREVYAAIRAAQPGGMGEVAEGDVRDEPRMTLREAMASAADRDSIAAEYTHGFPVVLQRVVPFLKEWPDFTSTWEQSLITLHLTLMRDVPDTLIARKCGPETCAESARRAAAVLAAGGLNTASGTAQLEELDRWLRADGHRRNPGTTADLIAAGLFAAAREGYLLLPDVEVPAIQ